jgi:hypothetical chaperone protein
MLDPHGGVVLRSLLYTPQKGTWFYGSEAINEYINHDGEGRFLRSIKKFLPEQSYSGTAIHNQNMNISEIVAKILGEMRQRANKQTGIVVDKVVLGRPALYSLDPELDQLAQSRMHKAAELAGYKEIHFCPEPVAAGLDYNTNPNDERIVLIADFGGGTSDFTLMKNSQILGLSGIFLAGDAIDGVMMKDFISPHFGANFEYQLPGSENLLKFPKGLLKKICSPAHITHLRERDTWEVLQQIAKFALSEQLFTLVEAQLGFPLFNEIEKTKIKLGTTSETLFSYHYPGIAIEQLVSDQRFRQSVTSTVDEVMNSMLEVFKQAQLTPAHVQQVCLTGGTSQFPLIRERLADYFGHQNMQNHSLYESVVNGLAQFAKKLV